MIRKLKDKESYFIYANYDNVYIEDKLLEINHSQHDCDEWVDENNFEHNEENKPSFIIYWEDDYIKKTLCGKQYRQHGKLHNLIDVAWIDYNDKGEICDTKYYIENIEYSKDKWEIEANRIKTLKEL